LPADWPERIPQLLTACPARFATAHHGFPRCSRVLLRAPQLLARSLRFLLLSPLMILTAHSDDARPFGNRNRVRAIAHLSQQLRAFTPALRSEADKNPRPSGAR